MSMRLDIQVSPGELLDRMTICEIKAERLVDRARELAQDEFNELNRLSCALPQADGRLDQLVQRLRSINRQLWVVEDKLRIHEKGADFGEEFVRLARSVYRLNDFRSAFKLAINKVLDCPIQEQKSHSLPSLWPRT